MQFFKYITVGLVLIASSLFFTAGNSLLSVQPQHAHAQNSLMSALGRGAGQGLGNCAASVATNLLGGALTGVASNLVSSAASNLTNPLSVPVRDAGTQATIKQGDVSRAAREGCLDGMMYAISKEVLNQLADSTLAWVESGFQRFGQPGNRGFVGDLDQFVANAGEQTYNQFVTEFRRQNQLCGPYREDVLMSVSAEYYRNNPKPSGVEHRDDINQLDPGGGGDCLGGLGPEATEAFYNGDFEEGGWAAFDYAVENPEASPVGAFVQQNERLTARIQQSRRLDLQELQQNNGWMSVVACPEEDTVLAPNEENNQDPTGGDSTGMCRHSDGSLSEPVVQTPGPVVNNAINNVIDSDFRRLELADETNEIVGALVNQLVANITGAGGDDNQGLFDPELANRTDPLGNINDYGGGEGYRGRVPVPYMASTTAEQIELEEELLAIVNQLPSTNELSRLEARLNQCLLEQRFPEPGQGSEGNPDEDQVEDWISSLRTAKKSVFPATRNAQEDEREVGAQKINWVGNKLEWSPGDSYGLSSCGDRRGGFEAGYHVSYTADVEDGEWKAFICLPEDGDEFQEDQEHFGADFYPISETSAGVLFDNGPLYRAPQNDVTKVDWNEAPFEWKHYDVFAEDFASYVYEADGMGNLILSDGTTIPVPGGGVSSSGVDIEAPANLRQILTTSAGSETNRYGSTVCDMRTEGQMSYVVKPNEEVWTHQRCEEVNPDIYRFMDTGETSDAFMENDAVNQIDQYVQVIGDLIGDEDSVDDSYQAPTGGPDNLYEFLHDVQRVTSEDESDIAQFQRTLDARFGRLEARFHTEADVDAAESALEQLNPDNPDSLYSRLQSLADTNSCPVPDDWSPPSDDDSSGGGGIEIVSFNAERRGGIILVNWQANAESCRAESAPEASSWSGEVGTAGSRGISTDDAVQLRLICEEGGETVRSSRYVPSYGREDRFGPQNPDSTRDRSSTRDSR